MKPETITGKNARERVPQRTGSLIHDQRDGAGHSLLTVIIAN